MSQEGNVNGSERPAHAPSWYTETMETASERGPLTVDLDVEVCVVGAGLAGLTTARELARRGWSVAVLEARRIAWNASGRNTGFVLPGFAQDIDAVVRRVGLDHAKRLWDLSQFGVDYVRATIRETGMAGVELTEKGWLKVAKTDDAEEDLALVRLLGQDMGAAVEGWAIECVREVLKSNHYFHAIHFPTAFHMHPLNYALGLAAAAEEAGARLFEDTPVVAIDTDGVRKRIDTPLARVRAAHVVLAGNVHLGAVLPQVSGTLVPVWTYVATTERLGSRLERAVSYRGAVSDTDFADNHYRIVDGDRLMWSGGVTTWEADPRRFAHQLKADIENVYPQLAPVGFEHLWSGVLGNTLHRMPQIGELSSRVWLASGFGGHGLNTTAMAGNIIARAIDEGDDTWRLFLPFELVWAGGLMGRAVAKTYYSWFRARERSSARLARRREEGYRRAMERQNEGQADRAPPA
jgi:gamma-glutamylputrescine oxidase